MLFVLATLSSMMAPTLADLNLARLAAREAIDVHRARGQHELVTIGQIVGFAVAALDTLRLSMPEDVSLSMKLRLRGNANGLNRSSCGCARLLAKARLCEPTETLSVRSRPVADGERQPALAFGSAPQGVDGGPAPSMTSATTVDTTAPPAGTVLTGEDWADAMQSVAATLQVDAVAASPEQRETDAMWIEALNGVGAELMRGKRQSSGPNGMRSGLMGALEAGMPPYLFRDGKRQRG